MRLTGGILLHGTYQLAGQCRTSLGNQRLNVRDPSLDSETFRRRRYPKERFTRVLPTRVLPADKQTLPNLTGPDSAPVQGLIPPLPLYGSFSLGRRCASCSTSRASVKKTCARGQRRKPSLRAPRPRCRCVKACCVFVCVDGLYAVDFFRV